VKNKPKWQLDDIIKEQKKVEKDASRYTAPINPDLPDYAKDILWREEQDAELYESDRLKNHDWNGGETTGNNQTFPSSRIEITEAIKNPTLNKFDEENPYDPFAENKELFPKGLPNKIPSSIEEMDENHNYYMKTVLEHQIEKAETSGIMAHDGVYGIGGTLRGMAGASGSVSAHYVVDMKGNKGILISGSAGDTWGQPDVVLTGDVIYGPNNEVIYDLDDWSITTGGSISIPAINANFGAEVVKPISEDGDVPAYFVYSAGTSFLPTIVPVEFHAEAGYSKVIPLGNTNMQYFVEKEMIDNLYEQLEKYKGDE